LDIQYDLLNYFHCEGVNLLLREFDKVRIVQNM